MSSGAILEDDWYEYEGPMALAGGGDDGGDTTTTTTTNPPAFQQPFIQNVLEQATALYNQGPLPYFPGSTVAGQPEALTAGFDSAVNQAVPFTTDIANVGGNALTQLVAGADPLNNPFFQSTLQALLRPITEGFTENVLPGIDAGAVQAGGFGGSRQGVAQGAATGNYLDSLGTTATTFGTNAYQAGLDSLGRALLAAPAVQQMGIVPSNILTAVGGAERGIEQEGINAEVDRFNFEQASPYDALSYYAGLVGNPLGSSVATTGPGPEGPSPFVGAAGGAAAGAAGYMMATGAANAWNPAGWAMMAGGALLGSGIL
jgi:hypothetical protein